MAGGCDAADLPGNSAISNCKWHLKERPFQRRPAHAAQLLRNFAQRLRFPSGH
jgi:hypothetical protein